MSLRDFIIEHENDDTAKLMLGRGKWPGIDMEVAVNTIETRRRLRGKVPSWYACSGLVYPYRLAVEQCSSEATALYKAQLVADLFAGSGRAEGKKAVVADLTSGMGVDDWAFSKIASEVRYNDMNSALAEAAQHNFKELGISNIIINNLEITRDNIADYVDGADLVFADPARRSESGRKVFLIEECAPDILRLKDLILSKIPYLLIKLSPMADITMVCKRLNSDVESAGEASGVAAAKGAVREVHVLGTAGECKELLILMDREHHGSYSIVVDGTFRFRPEDEADAKAIIAAKPGRYLLEPRKTLMKAAPYKLLCHRFGIEKLGSSTQLYFSDTPCEFFRNYEIIEYKELNNRNIKELGKKYSKAEVTARNLPLTSEQLKKKMGIISGDDAHIFGLKSDTLGNLLIVTRPVKLP